MNLIKCGKRLPGTVLGCCLLLCCALDAALGIAAERARVIVSTDIGGGDPDDHQSMIHYLLYADVFDTEGLISSPPQAGRASDILDCIAAYEKDYPNLKTWDSRYPTPAALRKIVRQGALESQAGATPESKLSDGAKLIVERARADDPRPLYVLVWGALTDVAQAVHAEPAIKARLRVYSIGSWNTKNGEKERDYLFTNHPDMWWIESDTTFRGMYMGGEQQGEWGNRSFPDRHVRGHGALGDLFMRKKADIKMGDSPTVLYLLQGDPDRPDDSHWGGAFVRPDPRNRKSYWHDNPARELVGNNRPGAKTVSRWRAAYLRDWQQRMDRVLAKKAADAR